MIHNVLVKERTKDNEFAAAMMLGLNVSEGAKALSNVFQRISLIAKRRLRTLVLPFRKGSSFVAAAQLQMIWKT